MFSNTKAALTRQLAFSLMLLSILISCKDNSIGSGFVDESTVVIDTINVTGFPENSADPYLGKLTYSPVGHFSDPLFGDLETVAFFRPDIDDSDGDSALTTAHNLHLRLYVYQSIQYGDTLNDASFSIYRVGSSWRGSAFKMSDEITILDQDIDGPFINKVGSFALSDIDTTNYVDIPLGGAWSSAYKTYYNYDEDDRETHYRENDFGLAILPDDGAEQFAFIGFGSSSLLVFDSDTTADTLSQSMLDWGYDLTRGEDSLPEENINLFSTFENFTTIDFSDVISQLNSDNFVRAELVLTENTTLLEESLQQGEVRSEEPDIRLRLTNEEDLAYDLAFNSTNSSGAYDEGFYRFNVTSLLNANIFGSTEIDEVYLYATPNGGRFNFNTFYGTSANESVAPKLLIYRIDTEE